MGKGEGNTINVLDIVGDRATEFGDGVTIHRMIDESSDEMRVSFRGVAVISEEFVSGLFQGSTPEFMRKCRIVDISPVAMVVMRREITKAWESMLDYIEETALP